MRGRWAALAVAMAMGSPAEAHCYRHWAYPRPQTGCGGVYARVRHHVDLVSYRRPAPAPQPAPPLEEDNDRSWYVEITKMPPYDEAVARQEGIEKLRGMLSK